MKPPELDIKRIDDSSTKLVSAKHAKTFFRRLGGLLGKKPLGANEGLLITPCHQVHTLGMTYPLDIIFLDKHGVILKCVNNLKPWRMTSARGAQHTLELPAFSIAKHGLVVGEKLHW